MPVWLIVCWLFAIGDTTNIPKSLYTVIIDAGSTGSRFFLFQQKGGSREFQYKQVVELHPGLHEQTIERVYSYLKPGLVQTQQYIPEDQQQWTKVYLYATAGMRLLNMNDQQNLYTNIVQEMSQDATIQMAIRREQVKTITGEEEGFYAVAAINYLAKTISTTLEPLADLFGALDLGGASTQIVFDVKERWRQNHVRRRRYNLKPIGKGDFYSHSFLHYGINAVRAKLIDQLTATEASKLMDPCLFKDGHGHNHTDIVGTGDALECIAAIQSIMKQDNSHCPTDSFCALQSYPQPKPRGKFYAFSVYHYAVSFAVDAFQLAKTLNKVPSQFTALELNLPNPKLQDIRAVAQVICRLTFSEVSNHNTPINTLTSMQQLPRRCFDLCYTYAILKQYGFEEDSTDITFVNSIEHQPIEWTIGAYLYFTLQQSLEELRQAKAQAALEFQKGLPFAWRLMWLVFFAVLFFLYTEVKRTFHSKMKSFKFINDASD